MLEIQKMLNLTLLLITKNESENLKKWSEWLPQLKTVNELVIVDGQSTDDTIKIAKTLASKKLTVKIINGAGDADFSTQRNLGISHCTNDMILWIDADELPSTELITFINQSEFTPNTNYAFKRQDIFLGHKLTHGETSDQHFLRMFHKDSGKFTGLVHEVWQSQLPTINLNLNIIHTPNRDLRQFISDINFYSSLRARELFESHAKVSLFEIILYPLAKFIQDYIFKFGFLDGVPGIILALSMSFHSFLVRSKLWTLLNP